MIPLEPAGMYTDNRSIHGGSGDPLLLLLTTLYGKKPRLMPSQLQSTRQRLESQAVASFRVNVSPIRQE